MPIPIRRRKRIWNDWFGQNVILPFHLWYPSAENLPFDGSGYTLLDTGTADVKHNLIGYNGAGSPASRTTLVVEGGITVPAINYNYSTNSYFFRGTTQWYNKLRGDYYEALLYPTDDTTLWSCMWAAATFLYNAGGLGGPSYGVYDNVGFIQAGVDPSTWSGHATTYGTGGRISGLLYGTGSSASAYITSTIKTSSFTNDRSTSSPMTIGCLAGASGAAGSGYTNRPIGPLAFYRGIFPAVSHATFLARRLARVQNGTWQPNIPLEDLSA